MTGISCRSSDRKKPKKYHKKPKKTEKSRKIPKKTEKNRTLPQISNLGLFFSVFFRFSGLQPPLHFPDIPTSLPGLTDLNFLTNRPHSPTYRHQFPDLPSSLPRLTNLTSPTYHTHSPDLHTSLPRHTDITSLTYRPQFPDLPTSPPRLTDLTPLTSNFTFLSYGLPTDLTSLCTYTGK